MTANDRVLVPLLEAIDPASREQALETILVEHVQPIAEGILSRYGSPAIRDEDAADLTGTVYLRVLRRLQQQTIEMPPIERLSDYVAATAFNVVHGFLRRKYPERTRLKNRMRYLLSRDRRFAIWEQHGQTLCGLAGWEGREAVPVNALENDPPDAARDRDAPAEALKVIFKMSEGPLRFEDLVRIAAELWQVRDPTDTGMVEAELSDHRNQAAELEMREYVNALWREVRELRPLQRAALLMNLRDVQGGNGVTLLLFSGVAAFDEIAETMGVTPERLAEIWDDLPFDDLTIGAMFGISRQQVISLRKAARERLARRTARFKKR